MVLESTMICVDTSEYMRNGDFIPSRLQAQQDAVSLICHSKIRSNLENNVGLITLSNNPEVLATMTMDVGKILAKLHQVEPKGFLNFMTGIKIAHLALKHRQGKNHKMRIVLFVGSPLELDEKDLEKQAKRLKKEKVSVDIINFGEETENTTKLSNFISILNGKEGQSSHLVTISPGPLLSEALISSPIIRGEDGQGSGLSGPGFEFGIDPNEDPELALALRVSMEEQRQRQEEEHRRTSDDKGSTATASASKTSSTAATIATEPEVDDATTEEAMLEKALAISMSNPEQSKPSSNVVPDFSAMTEEEQIQYAMQMSLAQAQEEPMETDDQKEDEDKKKDAK